MHQTLHATHYFSIQKLRLSKSLPPFGRRVAVRSLRQNLPMLRVAMMRIDLPNHVLQKFL